MQNFAPFFLLNDNSKESVRTISQAAARLSIAAAVTYQVLLVALIFIRPDLDPYWHTISEWAIGPHGWIMTIAFWISAVSYGALFVAIRTQVASVWGKLGLGILLICTVGLVGVGLFTTDPLDTPPEAMTTTGIIHLISGASQLLFLPFAALLINLSLALKNSEWAAARLALLLTAGVPLIGLIGFVVHLIIYIIPLGEKAYGPDVPIGWPPRFLFLTYMVWLVTLAWHALKLTKTQK